MTGGSRSRRKSSVASYTNRHGATYYLHGGTTKNGRPRYTARREIGDGALDEMPDGYEFGESINGMVSVRRAREDEDRGPGSDLELVGDELESHAHLRHHTVDLVAGAIVIYEPVGMPFAEIEGLAHRLGIAPSGLADLRARGTTTRYTPVMRFTPIAGCATRYDVARMTYSGDGGWWSFEDGPLPELLYVIQLIGTDAFFELI